MDALSIPVAPNSATREEIRSVFDLQKSHAGKMALTTARERKERIRKILDYTMAHWEELAQALHRDFRKTEAETIISELVLVKEEATLALKKLHKWMRPTKVSMTLALAGTSSSIHYVPKGNVLIISPWNYPFLLTIRPLIWAIAAGNVVCIKPSEMTPHASGFMKKMVEELFPPEEVAVFEGDYTIAQHLLEIPYNHIYFTGSPAVGKIVMRAAAEHLSSITLELGGKSPSIVDETANVKDAAERYAWGKTLNNGQTCIAPDYMLVHESVRDQFIEAYRQAMKKMFGEGGEVQTSASYSRVVNARHFHRINTLLEDAIEKGAKVEFGGQTDPAENFIAPTLLTNITHDMKIMQEEIFGPVLPLMTYRDKQEIVGMVQQGERPLAMYIFSKNQQTIQYLLDHIVCGDVVINDNLIQFGHPGLPIGGINNSGIGYSGGHAGFLEFSHQKSVMRQVFGTLKPLYPPYKDRVNKMIRFLLKYI